MKTKLVLASMLLMVLPLMAQTNSPVSVFVEVPSFTIIFPGTMSPSEIGDTLKKLYGTNLTFAFTITNSETHEQLSFADNSMPSMDKLQQMLVAQQQNLARNETNEISPVQSDTLTTFRKKYPQFISISDSQVVLIIGENFPDYLKQDKKFAEEFAKYSAAERQNSVPNSNNDIEERKAAALERQAAAQERQADALENQTFAQERVAAAAEDQALQQQIQSLASFQPSPIMSLPLEQPEHPTLIFVPGRGTMVVSPERPGQPQIITGPGLNEPIIISH